MVKGVAIGAISEKIFWHTPKKFWNGTKYVKPFVWFGDFKSIPKPEARLLFDDFSFVKSK